MANPLNTKVASAASRSGRRSKNDLWGRVFQHSITPSALFNAAGDVTNTNEAWRQLPDLERFLSCVREQISHLLEHSDPTSTRDVPVSTGLDFSLTTQRLDQQSFMAQVEENRRMVRNLLERLPVGIYVTGPQGEVFYANQRTAEIIGLIPKEALEDSIKYYLQTEGLKASKETPLDTLTEQARTRLSLRDFTASKIIESNLE